MGSLLASGKAKIVGDTSDYERASHCWQCVLFRDQSCCQSASEQVSQSGNVPGERFRGLFESASEQLANSGKKNSLAGASMPCPAVMDMAGMPSSKQLYSCWAITASGSSEKSGLNFILQGWAYVTNSGRSGLIRCLVGM